MEKTFKVPLIDGYDPIEDKTGDYMEFKIVGEYWHSTDEPPKSDGEYLLAIWDGYGMEYDLCSYFEGKWHVTNDWCEGEPIAYVAWMDMKTIIPS